MTAAYAAALLQRADQTSTAAAKAAVESLGKDADDALSAHLQRVLLTLTRRLKPR